MKSTTLLSAVALSAGLIMSGGTRAEEGLVGQLGFFGVGKAYEIEKGHFFWVGEFSGTFFSDKGDEGVFDHAGVKCPAWDDSNVNNKEDKAGGFCTFTDLSGDQAYMTWQDAGSTGSRRAQSRNVHVDGWNGKIQRNQGEWRLFRHHLGQLAGRHRFRLLRHKSIATPKTGSDLAACPKPRGGSISAATDQLADMGRLRGSLQPHRSLIMNGAPKLWR